MRRRYREFTSDDEATLQRMARAGWSDGAIAEHLDRDRAFIVRKRHQLDIVPGVSRAMVAILARINFTQRARFRRIGA